MSFPLNVREKALVACGRHCCICHRFVALKIELHHIKLRSEGGRNTFENCIPLCLDCHADMSSYDHRHPKGTKYTPNELMLHRDRWYSRFESTPPTRYDLTAKLSDQNLMGDIKSMLPWDGSVHFFARHPTSAPFPREKTESFRRFVERCEDPEFEFVDAELEGYRADLLKSIVKFLDHVDESTHPLDENQNYLAVPKQWRASARENFYAATTALRKSSDRIGISHARLLRSGKRKLGVCVASTSS